METGSGKRLNTRALVALMALISGICLPFTGLAVHMLHSDSLQGPRHFWTVAHEVLGIIFTVGTVWHIILNRGALARHIRGSTRRVAGISREAYWAAAAVGIVVLVAVGHVLVAH